MKESSRIWRRRRYPGVDFGSARIEGRFPALKVAHPRLAQNEVPRQAIKDKPPAVAASPALMARVRCSARATSLVRWTTLDRTPS